MACGISSVNFNHFMAQKEQEKKCHKMSGKTEKGGLNVILAINTYLCPFHLWTQFLGSFCPWQCLHYLCYSPLPEKISGIFRAYTLFKAHYFTNHFPFTGSIYNAQRAPGNVFSF